MRVRRAALIVGAVLVAAQVAAFAPAAVAGTPATPTASASPSPSTAQSSTGPSSASPTSASPSASASAASLSPTAQPTAQPTAPSRPTTVTATTPIRSTPTTALAPATGGTAKITGVVRSAGGAAVGHATISVYDLAGDPADDQLYDLEAPDPALPPVGTAVTSAAGRYTVSGLSGGTNQLYLVCADGSTATGGPAGGYGSLCLYPPISMAAGTTASASLIALRQGIAASGTVVDGSAPLAGIPVAPLASGFSLAPVGSAADGSYSVHGVQAFGERSVCADGSASTAAPYGYTPSCADVNGRAGQTVTGVTIQEQTAGAITGTVTDSAGTALAGALVETAPGGPTARTASNGSYTLRGVTPGTAVSLCVDGGRATGGSSTTGYLDSCYYSPTSGGDGPGVTVTAGALTTAPTVHLAAAGRVQGTITDASGNPVVNAAVSLDTSDGFSEVGTTRTGYDGRYDFPLAPGTYQACVTTTSSTDSTPGGSLGTCSSGNLVVDTGTVVTANLALASAGAITGSVTDTAGAGLFGAYVDVSSAFGNVIAQTVTSSSGAYRVAGLATGSYTVCFFADQNDGPSATGYLGQCWKNVASGGTPTPVTVTAGAVRSGISAKLAGAGGIAGTVTDAGGHPLRDVEVVASVPDQTSCLPYTGGVTARPGSARTRHAASSDRGAATAVRPADGGGCETRVARTTSDGSYQVTGLTGGSYAVCFDVDDQTTGGSSSTGYLDQCYDDVASGGTPTTVAVTAPNLTSGIDASLAPGGAISGTVTGTGGVQLPGVSVTVDGISATTTGSDGTYTAVGLSAGRHTVCFSYGGTTGSPTGYLPQCFNGKRTGQTPTAVAVRAGKVTTGVNATLAAGGAVSGTVTGGGAALAGVDVYVSDAAGDAFSGQTGSDGSYTVPGLATGSYTVCFYADGETGGSSQGGYVDACYDNRAPSSTGTPVKVRAGAATTVNATLAAGAGISGSVTSGGTPLAYVGVAVTSSTGSTFYDSTDQNGSYAVLGLKPGTYTVCFQPDGQIGGPSATGYLPQCWRAKQSGATPIRTKAGTLATGISADLAPAGAISGTVTTSSGAAIANVTVTATGGDGTEEFAQTDASGDYTVLGLAAGTVTVCFYGSQATGPGSTGYVAQCYDDQPTTGTPTPVSVSTGATTGSIDATLTAAGAVSGVVTDSSGAPIASATVFVVSGGDGGDAFTDSNGAYSLTGLPAGKVSVCVDASGAVDPPPTGYAAQCYDGQPPGSQPANVTVKAGKLTSGISFRLAVGALVTGTVTDSSGAATSSAFISFADSAGDTFGDAFPDNSGDYSASGVPAGTYSECAYYYDTGDQVCRNVTVASGGTATVDFTDTGSTSERGHRGT